VIAGGDGMTEGKKLEKVNDRLYQEPYKDGKYFQWEKKLTFVTISLTEIEVALSLNIERSETEIRIGETPEEREQREPSYSQEFGWRITGKGNLNGDRIRLIEEDGSISTNRFEVADVTLKPLPDTHRERAHGNIGHSDARYERRKGGPYIWLQLYAPKTEFDSIREELVLGRLNKLEIGVHIDVFESEVDRGLRDPDMWMNLHLPEDSYNNRAYLSWLRASRICHSEGPSEVVSDNPGELFATKGHYEEKINYFGKTLIGLEGWFKGIGAVVYYGIVYGAFGYLIYKGLAWLFHWS
jgi:hypothetical protein